MHNWQDIVLSIGSLIFAGALLPSIFSKHKPALLTSTTSGMVLIIFAITYASLSLWYATITTLLTGFMWIILAIQKAMQSKKPVDNNEQPSA